MPSKGAFSVARLSLSFTSANAASDCLTSGAGRIPAPPQDAALAFAFQAEQRAERCADGTAELDLLGIERAARAALERQDSRGVPVLQQRYGAHRDGSGLTRQLRLGDRTAPTDGGMDHRLVLIERLVHGVCDQPDDAPPRIEHRSV